MPATLRFRSSASQPENPGRNKECALERDGFRRREQPTLPSLGGWARVVSVHTGRGGRTPRQASRPRRSTDDCAARNSCLVQNRALARCSGKKPGDQGIWSPRGLMQQAYDPFGVFPPDRDMPSMQAFSGVVPQDGRVFSFGFSLVVLQQRTCISVVNDGRVISLRRILFSCG
jgi:hypothetical protein